MKNAPTQQCCGEAVAALASKCIVAKSSAAQKRYRAWRFRLAASAPETICIAPQDLTVDEMLQRLERTYPQRSIATLRPVAGEAV